MELHVASPCKRFLSISYLLRSNLLMLTRVLGRKRRRLGDEGCTVLATLNTVMENYRKGSEKPLSWALVIKV